MTQPNVSPQDVEQIHRRSDVDSSPVAQHHTLGTTPSQASPGNHNHDGRNSPGIVPQPTPSFIIRSNTAFALPATTFTKIPFPSASIVTNLSNAWDATANEYIIPTTGYYQVAFQFRIPDVVTTPYDIGLGVGAATGDFVGFQWVRTGPGRNRPQVNYFEKYSVGDRIFAYAFTDTAVSVGVRQFNVYRVSP